MDSTTLVAGQIEEGQELIDVLRSRGVDVSAAFWLRLNDDQRSRLYISSANIDSQGYIETYRAIDDAISALPSPRIDLFDVRLIENSSRLAMEAKQLQSAARTSFPATYHFPRLGELSVDEVVLYGPA